MNKMLYLYFRERMLKNEKKKLENYDSVKIIVMDSYLIFKIFTAKIKSLNHIYNHY